MSDPPLSRKLGRGFARLLAGIFGRKNLRRTRESLEVLGREYREGREEAEGREEPPRAVPHREMDRINGSGGPPPAS